MILDFDRDPFPETWTADVCIVGAGAAGLTLAHELTQRGRRVLLLEGGGKSRWERSSQALNKTYLEEHSFAGAHSGRFRCLGGSTSAWAGQVMELDDQDFAARDWAPGSGWPFPKSELAPFYARAEALEGVDGLVKPDQAVWSSLGTPEPFLSDDLTIAFSRWLPEKKFARLFADTLEDDRLLVVLHANAVELVPSEDGKRVASVRVRTIKGKEARVPVQRVALCLGGIESSRFLLNQSYAPWNASLVGRNFQDHLQCFVGDVRGVDLKAAVAPFGPWRLGSYLPKIKLTAGAQRRHRTLNVGGLIEFEDGVFPTLRTGIKVLTGPVSAIGVGEFARMAPRTPGVIWHHFKSKTDPRFTLPWARPKLSVYCEQSPLSESRIELSSSRDALGLRRASLSWRISDLELHTIRTYAKLVQGAFAAGGFGAIELDPDLMKDRFAEKIVDQFHHCGGTPMSDDPASGVVDTGLRLHGVENAYLCSSSVFPTSGFTNPTHTIIALAIRLSQGLDQGATFEQAAR